MAIDPNRVEVRPAAADREPGRSLLTAMASELDALYERVEGRLDSIPATPEQMAPPEGSFLLLLAGGAVVGCGGSKRLGPGLAEIKRMYIEPAARGQGLAAPLLDGLEQSCRELGYERVRLDTGPSQPAALALYLGTGYRAIADYNGNPYAAHWFEKEL